MAVTINITVEDVITVIASYDGIQVYSATSVGGTYALLDTIVLDLSSIFYEYDDSSGTLNTWYKYRFYNSGDSSSSDYSNPFQPSGATRLKLRQTCMAQFKAGITSNILAGSTTSVLKFSDYRVFSSGWSTGRGAGGWIRMTSGSCSGQVSNIVDVDPVLGEVSLSPALTASLTTGDQFEWHWLADPADWDVAVNQAVQRVYYLERLALVGAGLSEMSLAELGWLTDRNQIAGLWYYPNISGQGEVPWGSNGNWWSARQESGRVTLLFDPSPDSSTTIYLEALRQAPQLYTDDSVLPNDVSVDLLSAVLYDEVLSILCQPTAGAARDVTAWNLARADLKTTIRKQRSIHGPHPRWQQPQLQKPSRVTAPWSAR